MQFEGDWPGVFIRGDDAFALANVIFDFVRDADAAGVSSKARKGVKFLQGLLESCDQRLLGIDPGPNPRLKPFTECKTEDCQDAPAG